MIDVKSWLLHSFLIDKATLAVTNRWRRERGEPELRLTDIGSSEHTPLGWLVSSILLYKRTTIRLYTLISKLFWRKNLRFYDGKEKNVYILNQPLDYHDALCTPLSSPLRAFSRNWNCIYSWAHPMTMVFETHSTQGKLAHDPPSSPGFRAPIFDSSGTCVTSKGVQLKLSLMADLRRKRLVAGDI